MLSKRYIDRTQKLKVMIVCKPITLTAFHIVMVCEFVEMIGYRWLPMAEI